MWVYALYRYSKVVSNDFIVNILLTVGVTPDDSRGVRTFFFIIGFGWVFLLFLLCVPISLIDLRHWLKSFRFHKYTCKKCGGKCRPSKALINPLECVSEWSDGDVIGSTVE
jgi:hypothetical protein